MAGVVKSTAVPAYVTDLPTSDTSLNKHLLTPEKQLAMCRYWCLECCSHRKSRHVLEWPTKNADFIWNSLTIGVCELLELISKFVDVVLWCQSQLAVMSVSTCCDVSHNLLCCQSQLAVMSVSTCCDVSHNLLWCQSQLAVISVSTCCAVSHNLLCCQSQLAVMSVSTWCDVSLNLMWCQSQLAVLSVTTCCDVSLNLLWCQSQLAVLSVSTYCDVSLNLLSLLYCSIAWQTRQLANLSATFIWICFHVKANMATLPALVSRYWSPFDSRTGAKICCCMPAFGANFENLYFTR